MAEKLRVLFTFFVGFYFTIFPVDFQVLDFIKFIYILLYNVIQWVSIGVNKLYKAKNLKISILENIHFFPRGRV